MDKERMECSVCHVQFDCPECGAVKEDSTASEAPSVADYVPGATVRQYHHDTMFDDAIIIAVHPNGGLDVEIDGVKYGWSVNTCKVLNTQKRDDMSILDDLRNADRKGVGPPQNWTTRAADEIEKLQYALREITEMNVETHEDAFEMQKTAMSALNI